MSEVWPECVAVVDNKDGATLPDSSGTDVSAADETYGRKWSLTILMTLDTLDCGL